MSRCPCPESIVLNGSSANSEGGRIRNLMRACGGLNFKADTVTDSCVVCPPPQTVKPTITPAESSRIASQMLRCGSSSGSVTQSRVKELLQTQGRQNFGSEGVRIDRLIQSIENCVSNLTNFNNTLGPDGNIYNPSPTLSVRVPYACPPLPPPPAPPARACPLTKNQKY